MSEQIFSTDALLQTIKEVVEQVVDERLSAVAAVEGEEQPLTVRQLAKKLGKSETSLYRAAQSGELPSYKIAGTVYFKYSEVMAVSKRRNGIKEAA